MMRLSKVTVLVLSLTAVCTANYTEWLHEFGHDTFQYPDFITEQMRRCVCTTESTSSKTICLEDGVKPSSDRLTFCLAKQFLASHMPEFDKNFLPPSVSVAYGSMLDDNIAFSLMAYNSSRFAARVPLALWLHYVLPYATYHESRVNWRPLFFAKYIPALAGAESSADAVAKLTHTPFHDGLRINWTDVAWPGAPGDHAQGAANVWASSTSPPIIGPFDMAAYGYASCTGWSTTLSYALRAVGIPARPAGTPCWNQAEFAGLAVDNPNVTRCWHGGLGSDDNATGGRWLFNHNWVEYWDEESGDWQFVNVPDTPAPDTGLCNWSKDTGCNWSNETGCDAVTSGPGVAARDHEIFAVTWSLPDELGETADGGPVVDVADLRLSNGEEVSPLVWSPRLSAPLSGQPLKNVGLRVVNRTAFYRCRDKQFKQHDMDRTEEPVPKP